MTALFYFKIYCWQKDGAGEIKKKILKFERLKNYSCCMINRQLRPENKLCVETLNKKALFSFKIA
jgi:hypothetical protein